MVRLINEYYVQRGFFNNTLYRMVICEDNHGLLRAF